MTAGGVLVAVAAGGPARTTEADRTVTQPEAAPDLTFTAVPPGSGRRIGIDRDLDGVLDGDEGSGHLAQRE